jgi:GntR family transcriptional regulator
MLHLKLSAADRTPLFEQVAGAIRRAITEGDLTAGERLAPAREIAAALGVNANTVLRALRSLRNEDILELRRGRGASVALDALQRSTVLFNARELVELSRREGYERDKLIQMIEAIA